IAPVLIGVVGIAIAMVLYKTKNDRAQKISEQFNGVYQLVYHKLYIDELYLFITKKLVFNLIGKTAAWVDKNIVDGFVNLTGTITQNLSEAIKKLQSGKVQQYGIYFFTSVIVIVVVFLYLWN
ncbi:MAG: NADH-quinone oxidoreductase subunit L, partial [Sphingobacteriia bacterium]